MNEISTSEMAEFLERYKPISESKRVEEFSNEFKRLKVEFQRVKDNAAQRALTEAPAFNIFSLLGVHRDEVGTHSRFLADLLNPAGRHGQGYLFLRSLLDLCWTKFPDFPQITGSFEAGRWTSHREMAMQHGRMDIVLMNPLHGFLCVIENKVRRGEGSQQLERYWKWLDLRHRDYPAQALIYLTPGAWSSDTVGDRPYFRLSYRQDIASWLDLLLPKIQAPGVREVVKQYIYVVNKL